MNQGIVIKVFLAINICVGLLIGRITTALTQDVLSLDTATLLASQRHLNVFVDSTQKRSLAQVIIQKFTPSQTVLPLQTKHTYWLRVKLKNNSTQLQKRYLYVGNWAYIDLYANDRLVGQSGRMRTYATRSVPNQRQFIEYELGPQQSQVLYFKLQETMAFYLKSSLEFSTQKLVQVQKQTNNIRFSQGIFLGIIIVMALYNLFIFFSVKDVSFLYYVFSIVGVGLYFMFYYGFTLELIWTQSAIWNAHSYGIIVPLTRITWVLFTKSYLHLHELLPRWNRWLNWLIYLYLVPILLTLLTLITGRDFSLPIVNWIGTLGVIVLSVMVLMGFLALRKGFKPARYFLIANIFFSIGLILFIFEETGYAPATDTTRYIAQLGIIFQVTLFSLGLANRLNSAQKALAQKEIEKEVERKQLIEQQKQQLEVTVTERTADLRQKTQELEDTIQKLQKSEKDLKELNHIKDKFFSIISHDLRSPFATLTSFLNILINFADEFSKEEMEELAKRTQQSVKNLSSLLENLLQWAMSQMDQNQFRPQEIVLEKIIQETTTLLAVSAEEKKIAIAWDIPQNTLLYTDYNMLSFIIRNLLINAIKYTPNQGHITITAQTQNSPNAQPWVQICVADTGIGIPETELPKLFNAQEHYTRKGTQNEKGVGLGLMLCKEFVEKSGGTITVSSKLNEGTVFCFEVPGKE
ncbi:MAG TPA: histidine kinase [Microscillaceae bacterium]|nr:histidine kinase [Microscillaceae bacterium]